MFDVIEKLLKFMIHNFQKSFKRQNTVKFYGHNIFLIAKGILQKNVCLFQGHFRFTKKEILQQNCLLNMF